MAGCCRGWLCQVIILMFRRLWRRCLGIVGRSRSRRCVLVELPLTVKPISRSRKAEGGRATSRRSVRRKYPTHQPRTGCLLVSVLTDDLHRRSSVHGQPAVAPTNSVPEPESARSPAVDYESHGLPAPKDNNGGWNDDGWGKDAMVSLPSVIVAVRHVSRRLP